MLCRRKFVYHRDKELLQPSGHGGESFIIQFLRAAKWGGGDFTERCVGKIIVDSSVGDDDIRGASLDSRQLFRNIYHIGSCGRECGAGNADIPIRESQVARETFCVVSEAMTDAVAESKYFFAFAHSHLSDVRPDCVS